MSLSDAKVLADSVTIGENATFTSSIYSEGVNDIYTNSEVFTTKKSVSAGTQIIYSGNGAIAQLASDNTFTGTNRFNGKTISNGETIFNNTATFNGNAVMKVDTDYTTSRGRNYSLQTTTPTSISNGAIVGVYE